MPSPEAAHRRGAAPIRWGGVVLQVLAWWVAIVAFALIAALVIVPRIAGATPYTIETGSMSPGMPPGTVVVVRPVPFASIRVGDVVTYQLRSGEPTVVTHRVVAVDVDEHGVATLRTRGDANTIDDAAPVRAVQVRGVAWYHLPLVGYLGIVGTGDQRAWIARGVGALLLGYAVFLVVTGLVRRARGRRRGSTPSEGHSN